MGGAYDKPHRQECRPKKALPPPPWPPHCPHLLLMGCLSSPLLSCWVFALQRTRVSFENRAFKRLWVSLIAGLEDCLWDLLLSPFLSALFSHPGPQPLALPVPAALASLLFPSGSLCLEAYPILASLRVPANPTEFTRPFLTPPLRQVT